MKIYIEIFILYFLIFLSGTISLIISSPVIPESPLPITGVHERIIIYNILSLALIWFLLLKRKQTEYLPLINLKKDMFSGIIALPALIITGFAISFISMLFGGKSTQIELNYPSVISGWIILFISCISTGYLEESFFRFYILSKREELKLGKISAAVLSAVLFSVCHIYEGPWGFINSFIAAIILAYIFLRYNSLHGIAAAHGLYNFIVYIAAAATNL
jgi:membrane protease YdiL (CAAX protease family)